MLAKINIYLRMKFKYKLLFIINFVLLGIARFAINIIPFKFLSRYFGTFQKTVKVSTIISRGEYQQSCIIGKFVRLSARYTPWNSSCLTQAMVAKFWCKFYHIPYVFYIGMKKSDSATNKYDAHAWVMAGPVAVTGGHGLLNYHVISAYWSH